VIFSYLHFSILCVCVIGGVVVVEVGKNRIKDGHRVDIVCQSAHETGPEQGIAQLVVDPPGL
jgi:hypothetical protein